MIFSEFTLDLFVFKTKTKNGRNRNSRCLRLGKATPCTSFKSSRDSSHTLWLVPSEKIVTLPRESLASQRCCFAYLRTERHDQDEKKMILCWASSSGHPQPTPVRESSLLSLVDLGTTWTLSLVSTNGESTLTPGSIWGSTLLPSSPRYVLSRVTASWSGFSCVWGLRWVCRKKGRERVQKGVAASPAWGMSHPCDFMVVQELGNIWPGWRGLGKGVFTPNRFLSPPWGKNKC